MRGLDWEAADGLIRGPNATAEEEKERGGCMQTIQADMILRRKRILDWTELTDWLTESCVSSP